jgi:type I restriction enzyme M protein
MTINLLTKDAIYFEKAYNSNDNIILKVWDDLTTYQETPATNFISKETKEPVEVIQNEIFSIFSYEDVLEQPFVTVVEPVFISGKILQKEIDINNIYISDTESLYLLDNEELFNITSALKKGSNISVFEVTPEGIVIKVKKQDVILTKITEDYYTIQDKTFFINNYSISQFEPNEEDEEESTVSFGVDYLNNVYLMKDSTIKIINSGKATNIKKDSIQNSNLILDGSVYVELKETILDGVKEINIVTLKDITDLLWSVADEIRDRTKLDDTMDYLRLGIPFLFLKRMIDLRKEYILHELNNHVDNDLLSGIKNPFIEKIEDYRNEDKFFETKKGTEWYCITWDDLMTFTENTSGEEREISLTLFPELMLKTSARTKPEFLIEIVESLTEDSNSTLVTKMFDTFDFVRKVKDGKKVPEDVFLNICTIFSNLELTYENASQDIFSQAYMYFIETFVESAGKKGGEFFTPTELIEKLLPLLDLELPENGNFKIGDLAAGSASFLVESFDLLKKKYVAEHPDKSNPDVMRILNQKITIVSQEIGENADIMGGLNLSLKEIQNAISYHANSITEYKDNIGTHKGTFDCIVANPPYGLKDYGYEFALNESLVNGSTGRWQYGVPKKGDGDVAFLLTIIDLLNRNGKAGVVLPLGTLFKDSTQKIRKALIAEDLIEGLVVLPGNMFQTTGIPVVMWILNKNKKDCDKGKIFMVNSSSEFIKKGVLNEWQEENTHVNYLGRIEEEGLSRYVELDEIIENDFNLSVQRYVFKDEPEEIISPFKLKDDMIVIRNEIEFETAEMDRLFDLVLEITEEKV